MVLRQGCAEEVVGAGRLFLRQVRAERPDLPGQRAVRRGVSEVDGNGRRLLGRTLLCAAFAGRTEARARLRGGGQGHRAGSARRSGEGLEGRLQGRRQEVLTQPPGARVSALQVLSSAIPLAVASLTVPAPGSTKAMNDLSASSQITYRAVPVRAGVTRRIRG